MTCVGNVDEADGILVRVSVDEQVFVGCGCYDLGAGPDVCVARSIILFANRISSNSRLFNVWNEIMKMH